MSTMTDAVLGGSSTPPPPQSLFALTGVTIDTEPQVYLPPPPPPLAFVHTAITGHSAQVDNIEFPW